MKKKELSIDFLVSSVYYYYNYCEYVKFALHLTLKLHFFVFLTFVLSLKCPSSCYEREPLLLLFVHGLFSLFLIHTKLKKTSHAIHFFSLFFFLFFFAPCYNVHVLFISYVNPVFSHASYSWLPNVILNCTIVNLLCRLQDVGPSVLLCQIVITFVRPVGRGFPRALQWRGRLPLYSRIDTMLSLSAS